MIPLLIALAGLPGPSDLWIGVTPTMAKAQLMVARFRRMIAETKAPCGNPKIIIAHEVWEGQEYFWPKVYMAPVKSAPCARATFPIWVTFNDLSNDGGRTVYAYTYGL